MSSVYKFGVELKRQFPNLARRANGELLEVCRSEPYAEPTCAGEELRWQVGKRSPAAIVEAAEHGGSLRSNPGAVIRGLPKQKKIEREI